LDALNVVYLISFWVIRNHTCATATFKRRIPVHSSLTEWVPCLPVTQSLTHWPVSRSQATYLWTRCKRGAESYFLGSSLKNYRLKRLILQIQKEYSNVFGGRKHEVKLDFKTYPLNWGMSIFRKVDFFVHLICVSFEIMEMKSWSMVLAPTNSIAIGGQSYFCSSLYFANLNHNSINTINWIEKNQSIRYISNDSSHIKKGK
jgi:hypothetical protein